MASGGLSSQPMHRGGDALVAHDRDVLTPVTPVSTEPFSQPFAGAQHSARNG